MHVLSLESLDVVKEFPGCAPVRDGAGGHPAADELVGDFARELIFAVAVLGEDRESRAGSASRGGESFNEFEDVGEWL